jgi:hypothetical protein
MREGGDPLDGLVRLLARRRQQRLRHLHRVGRAHHHERRGAFGGFERNQRAHAVADEGGLGHAGRIQQAVQPLP